MVKKEGELVENHKTILIIEDDSDIRHLLILKFESEGYIILSAKDEEDAIIILLSVIPDLIICDWILPKTTGITIIKNLRSQVKTSNVPIILLSAKGTLEDQEIGLKAGANAYVIKPFLLKNLLIIVEELLLST